MVQDYAVSADSFVYGKFILSLIGVIEESSEMFNVYDIRSQKWNFQFLVNYGNENRLAQDWIVNGFWDYDKREWLGSNDIINNEPIDRNKTRRAYNDSEKNNYINTEYIEEYDERLFTLDRNNLNTWELQNDEIGTYKLNPKTGQRYFIGKMEGYDSKECLTNDFIKMTWKNFQIMHFVLSNFKYYQKLDKSLNWNSNTQTLPNEFFDDLQLLQTMPFEDYIDYINNNDRIKDLRLDGSWEITEFYGYWLTLIILSKLRYTFNNDLSSIEIDNIKTIINRYVDIRLRIALENDFETPFVISNSNPDFMRIYNEQNGMYIKAIINFIKGA